MQNIRGRIAFVTGAGMGEEHGIGSAIALTLARAGAAVWVQDIDSERAANSRDRIEAEGMRCEMCIGDIRDVAACSRFAEIVSKYGRALDILVNSAAISSCRGRLETLDLDQWQAVLDVNLKGVMLVTRAFIEQMVRAQRGSIVNVASLAGLRASIASFGYPPSKAALLSFTQNLAATYGRDGIRANAVAPGHLFTPMISGKLTELDRHRRRAVAPLPIEGNAWDVADAVRFLASDEARFITGVCLPVYGGASIVSGLATVELVGDALEATFKPKSSERT